MPRLGRRAARRGRRPAWDTTDPDRPRPEQGLLGLRSGLGLYANLRPVRPWPALYDASPLRRERIEGTDLLVVRELTGGLYFGDRGREDDRAFDTCVYTLGEVARLAEWGFRAAGGRRGKVTSVDKANVLETSRLWREQVIATAAGFPEIELEHLLVDNAAMQLLSRPADFDVIITENLFGDILSDEAAQITGSIGMLPSACLGGRPGPLRAGARLGAGHRGPGHRQPHRHLPVGRHDAALLAGGPGGGRPHRRGGGRRARRRPSHPRPGRWRGPREVGDRLLAALGAA